MHTKGNLARRLSVATLLVCAATLAGAYPEITLLSRDDPTFIQLQEDVAAAYQDLRRTDRSPVLVFYSYTVAEGDSIYGLSARFSVPYATIVTVNRLPSADSLRPGTRIVVPSVPGLFVPTAAQNELEQLMIELRREQEAQQVTVIHEEQPVPFRFFPGADFSPDERKAFLGLLFRHPVPQAPITSPFGNRNHPITGTYGLHAGVDYGAAPGSPVRAARSGTVTRVGTDPIMGNYVLIEHAGGFETFYGHLQSAVVTLNQRVESGTMIGLVGSTGVSTGPHLHFEIRHNGIPRDPVELLP